MEMKTEKKPRLTEEQKLMNKKISQKKYYEANKIAIMEQHKQYLKNYDKTKKNAYANKWYKNNKDKVALKMKLKKASLTDEQKQIARDKQKIYRTRRDTAKTGRQQGQKTSNKEKYGDGSIR